MLRKKKSLKKTLMYCGLEKDEFRSIKGHIAKRNNALLKFSSAFISVLAFCFLLMGIIGDTVEIFPYAFLLFANVVVFILRCCIKNTAYVLGILLSYAQMMAVFLYAIVLSFMPNNIGMPATSVIVFFSMIPLTIDDRPVRMIITMTVFYFSYMFMSYAWKAPEIFRVDLLNCVAFYFSGITMYIVICLRNVKEINQDVKIKRFQGEVITSLAMVVESRDHNTGEHISRTVDYVRGITRAMRHDARYLSLRNDFLDLVVQAAPMHDVGKVRISDIILNKPAKLTEEEYAEMKKHTVYGAELIKGTMKNIEEEDFFDVAHNVALYHHERYDGKGYPYGLAGEDIPIEARIMAIADVYDALVSDRVYKKAIPKNEAIKIIKEGAGTQFDSHLVDLFCSYIEKTA
ncbi:MAG: HD domain-containing protein [Clostridia bacterium]|nr:HD domain-containing protein [Clostridia bacterium]